jgi:hypothetical protein
VKVWATRDPGGAIRIVLINKDTVAHTVVLGGRAMVDPLRTLVARLQAPATPSESWCAKAYVSTGLCATSGITLGGWSFGPGAHGVHAGDRTSTGRLPAAMRVPCTPPHGCVRRGPRASVIVPAGSAALITELPEPPRACAAVPLGVRICGQNG